ncbi:MAG: OmpH family outer membrane protein [Bacteroidales bacterium]|nr:OmpH family outer membrane protein [Bacteroidales bacterium]
MKKIIASLIIAATALTAGVAQKYAFVDTEYILNRIPSYTSAQDQLDKLSEEWQQEIEEMYTAIETMYKNYQTEKVLLSEDMRVKKEGEIINKEKEAKDLQNKYFGREGSLYTKRQELVKPIQDEIFRAVKEIATEGNFAVIFDTSSGANMLYTNPKYDMSDDVLEKLGYKN